MFQIIWYKMKYSFLSMEMTNSPRMTQVFTWKHPKRLPDNCIYLIIPCLHKSVDVWRVALLTVHQNSIRTLNRTQPLSLGNTHGFTTMNPLELTHLHSCRPLLVLKPRLTPSRRWTPPPGPRCRNRDRSVCLYTPVGFNKYTCKFKFYPWRTQAGCLNILISSTLIFNANSSISASGCARPSWREFVFGNNLSSKHAPDIKKNMTLRTVYKRLYSAFVSSCNMICIWMHFTCNSSVF